MTYYKVSFFYLLRKVIKIGHKKRYENIKKEYKKKEQKINFISHYDETSIVIETTYNNAFVYNNNEIYEVTLDKKFKSIINKTIYPGDKVVLKDNKIVDIVKRRNTLFRFKSDGTKLNNINTKQIIATNIDLAIIVVAVKEPLLHPKFIDRYIVLLEASDIPYIICFNKCDLLTEKEQSIIDLYNKLGYKCLKTSIKNKDSIEKLKDLINNKQVIFVGHSGVGKSSLTNAIVNNKDIKINSIGSKSNKGRHTTIKAKYYKWNKNSSIIDTPGIRSLDLKNYNVYEIKKYFKEFSLYNDMCKYQDCLHYEEPLEYCKVKQMVGLNITKERYDSYCKIIEEILSK